LHWRKGGFYRARLGLESGSERLLKVMKKNISLDEIKTTVKNLAEAGIKTTTYWIVGYPGETEDDFQKTIDLITELKNDIYEAEANPFWYYEEASALSSEWGMKSKSLFSDDTKELLMLDTLYVDVDPLPEVRFNRLKRFVKHCNDLDIPNPYSLETINAADERWIFLHNTAVPCLLDLMDKN
jgi:hypothetical protein